MSHSFATHDVTSSFDADVARNVQWIETEKDINEFASGFEIQSSLIMNTIKQFQKEVKSISSNCDNKHNAEEPKSVEITFMYISLITHHIESGNQKELKEILIVLYR
eukprot:988147_1